ncbi:MAG: F0F1 ATP synthase subunit epsilon [Gammaproteobacteria bacterium]|nr:F0F1 ATP synthase subunit epsilon [Gammaproteobacteria bacterium]
MKGQLTIHIVNAEQEVFSGVADKLIVMGEMGEMGIMPGHTPLLSPLKAGEVRVCNGEQEEVFFVSGGMLEVQPHTVTILADTALRAKDLDEVAVIEAKKRAEKLLTEKQNTMDVARAMAALNEAIAQLRAIEKLKNKR